MQDGGQEWGIIRALATIANELRLIRRSLNDQRQGERVSFCELAQRRARAALDHHAPVNARVFSTEERALLQKIRKGRMS